MARGNGREAATYLFESNRLKPFSTRRIHQIIHQYAAATGIERRGYPHPLRHQIISYLTRQGIISPKLQLLSGHSEEKSLAIYRDFALTDGAAITKPQCGRSQSDSRSCWV